MFETAEVGHTISKAQWSREEPRLREALLDAQFEVGKAGRFPVLVVIGGVEGAGKGETVQELTSWMDPRHIVVNGFGPATDEERDRPEMYRFWRALPPRGQLGIFFGSWYTSPIVSRVMDGGNHEDLERAVTRIRHLERMLHNEGVLVLKFWLHLSKQAQRQRFEELEGDKRTSWRVTHTDWQYHKRYDRFRAVSEHVLRETSTGEAPWIVVEGSDHRYRSLTVGKVLLEAMTKRLAAPVERTVTAAPPVEVLDNRKLLRSLDLRQKVKSEAKYEKDLEKLQGDLNRLARHKRFARRSLVLVFEGSDAAGKGGTIRRVTGALDPRHYRIVPVAKPTDEEYAQPYLWRFWRHVPALGGVTIFDRSWYGRVLVERVEGFCAEADWMRAYDEINEFEEQLTEAGAVVCKFWLQISAAEQLRRFKERERTPFKRFKITPEDWRNRKKWGAYEGAVCDLVERTSTTLAPWTLVEAEDKRFARLKVLRTLVDRLREALD